MSDNHPQLRNDNHFQSTSGLSPPAINSIGICKMQTAGLFFFFLNLLLNLCYFSVDFDKFFEFALYSLSRNCAIVLLSNF